MALNLSRNTKVYVSSANGVGSTGGIRTATVTTAGSGHAVGDVISFAANDTSGSGINAKVIVSAVGGSGAVSAVHIPNNLRGSGFVNSETLTQGDASDSTGSGTGLVVTVASVAGTTTVDGTRIGTGLFKGNGTNANTFRVGVLDGYSFSQGSDATDVVINEAGATPNRGQKRFNDSLPPAEWSFSTYVRPYKHGTNSSGTDGTHSMCENILWAAIAGKDITGGALSGTSAAAVTLDSTDADVSFARSEHHELLKLSIFFALENTTYRLNECQVNQAEIDFSIDGIATIAWSGNSTTIDQITTPMEDPNTVFSTASSDTGGAYSANASINNAEALNYVDTTGPDDADYLRNKLSTLTLTTAEQGSGASSGGLDSKTYDIAITGGSITIANNITYVTPETLGLIDKPIGSFSGARQISGSLTMYLNTTGSSGSGNGSNQLLADLAGATDLVRNSFDMSLFMGGGSSDTPIVEFDLPRAHLQVPTIEVADLISVGVEFAAHGSDITNADEMTVKYKGLTEHSDSSYATNHTV
jgi:hypothetical protein